MDLLLWITIVFIVTGFIFLNSMKKGMESKIAFIKANLEEEESSKIAKYIIWWIGITTAWGIASIILIVWLFHNHFG